MSPPRRLEIVRILPAAPAVVFAAWTEPAQMAAWFCPGTVRETQATLDVRVGGRYRVVMRDGERDVVHDGEYLEVSPPTRLVFTWASPFTHDRPTRVTIELFSAGPDTTRLVLTHDELPDDESFRNHERGWTSAAVKLETYVAGRA